jgi:hypothetical protein
MEKRNTSMSRNQQESLYETDFHAWAFEQARKLRAGEAIDVENVAEELEDLGRTERRHLRNHLAVLLQHMLKWEFQTDNQSASWAATIKVQRRRVNKLLAEMPSLKASLAETIGDAYESAVIFASAETMIIEEDFPAECPYTVEEILETPEPSKRRRNGPSGGNGKKIAQKAAAKRWEKKKTK